MHSKRHAHGRRSARHLLLFGGRTQKRAWWVLGGVAAAVALGFTLLLVFTELDWGSVQRGFARINPALERLSPALLIPAMAVLPVFGFPIAVVYLVAGAKFGPLLGGVVVAGVTAVHLLATHAITQSVLRGPIERFMEKRHHHLPHVPEDEQAAVSLIAALIPGLPYFVRNYLLALAGVRLRYYFWVCLPVYVARSYVTILLGDLSSDPTRRGLVILLVVDVLKVAICAFVIWRLRQHHRKYHGHHAHDEARGHNAPAPQTGGAR
jgi:uncharacterized membrane protein YdjX (TVP38/TMEM64 family)